MMSLLKPKYKINIGSISFDLDISIDVISVRVSLNMDVPAGSFEIFFVPSDKSYKIKMDDEVSIRISEVKRVS